MSAAAMCTLAGPWSLASQVRPCVGVGCGVRGWGRGGAGLMGCTHVYQISIYLMI